MVRYWERAELSPALLLGSALLVPVAFFCRLPPLPNRDFTSESVRERVMTMAAAWMVASRSTIAGICEGMIGGVLLTYLTGAAVAG